VLLSFIDKKRGDKDRPMFLVCKEIRVSISSSLFSLCFALLCFALLFAFCFLLSQLLSHLCLLHREKHILVFELELLLEPPTGPAETSNICSKEWQSISDTLFPAKDAPSQPLTPLSFFEHLRKPDGPRMKTPEGLDLTLVIIHLYHLTNICLNHVVLL